MTHSNYLIVFAFIAAMAVSASKLDLSLAINKTLCPTVVKYNVIDSRIPRVIKTIGCDEDPDDVCKKIRKPGQCCRDNSSDRVVTECVEVVDNILVTDRATGRRYSIKVPVGCSCIMEEVKHSRDLQ